MTDFIVLLLRVVATLAVLSVIAYFANARLSALYAGKSHLRFRLQLIQMAGILVVILFAILFLPFDDVLRGQLLSLYGLIISATIALSSTTLVGNVMAGIMLKTIGSCRPGDYITVGDYFGRISEMDLLHTEIQTEERDLATLPNMFLVTNPVRVMRNSGTVLSVELSLGYEVSRNAVEKVLLGAAQEAGLESPFVQIRSLGDYSVTYRISGLLKEVNRLLGKRRELRARTMDALHDAGIEIVSPTFMNTRSYRPGDAFIPEASLVESPSPSTSPDSLVFDKAEKAESVSKLREKLEEVQERLSACTEAIASAKDEEDKAAAEKEKAAMEERVDRLKSLIERKEEKISKE